MEFDNENGAVFNYDTGFLCTYHLMNDLDDEDTTLSENLYRVQMAQALRMNMDIAKVLAGDDAEFDDRTMNNFIDFISDKTKPYYDERYKAVLRKHPCLKKAQDNMYESFFVNENSDEETESELKKEMDDVVEELAEDIDDLINDVVPMLLAYHSFHAFHRCMIDVFSHPNAMGLISDESLRLLEESYDGVSDEMNGTFRC
jgi:hypothetical protein